jgi:DAK2 domain fusion protein YloV
MSRKSWDGVELVAALRTGAERLHARVAEVNALNVFPVPDGDTGTNMLATLRAAVAEGEAALATGVTAIDVVSEAVARGALLGARGNSGVLLSQILRGLPHAVRGRRRARASEIANALSIGTLFAYAAVATPVEGTILTVAREVAAAAMSDATGATELRPFLHEVAASARRSVEKTPTLLAVLREAGVVDSGGAGLQIILEGIAAVPSIAPSASSDEADRRIDPTQSAGAAPMERTHAAARGAFGYETVFIVSSNGAALNLAKIRSDLESIGESVLVAGDERVCKVHVHNARPDEILAYGFSVGDVDAVTIENLDAQSAERATGHEAFKSLSPARVSAEYSRPHGAQESPPMPSRGGARGGVSVVAVAAGEGLAAIMTSAGATEIVHGGQTENPSAAEIADAIRRTGSESVVVLPNNSNIVLAARQAAALVEGTVIVVPTRNAAEGIAALLAWDPSLTIDGLVAKFETAREAARTFRIVEAVRDATVHGVSVAAGETMAIDAVDGIIATGPDDVTVLARALANESAELITLYVGAAVDDGASADLVAAARGAVSGAEVELQRGGQPIERVLVSLE